jgi:GAF domain-containing protein
MTERVAGASPQEAFAELGAMSADGHPLNDILVSTVNLARLVLPFEVESSITLIDAEEATTPAFTGRVALELDETQYSLGYGPCLAAAEAGQQIAIPDTAADYRWPRFSRDASDKGVRSTLSVPLPVQRQLIGALNMYSTGPDAFDAGFVALTEKLGAYAAVAISNTTLYVSASQQAEQMAAAMASRAVIEQAKGMLMAQHKCDADEAFNLLVKLSQQTGRKLRAVAVALVDHSISGGP